MTWHDGPPPSEEDPASCANCAIAAECDWLSDQGCEEHRTTPTDPPLGQRPPDRDGPPCRTCWFSRWGSKPGNKCGSDNPRSSCASHATEESCR